jgi:hypothetical protein
VRKIDREEDLVLIAVLNKIYRDVRSMAIKDK